ncbi:MAG: hypothetical protein Fur006_02990 [Coleofasciculaceae cyanobacterium]
MSEKKRFLLRLDPKLYEVLEKWSADELRSVNAQIEYLLKEAARKAGRWNQQKRSRISPQQQDILELEETPEDDTE